MSVWCLTLISYVRTSGVPAAIPELGLPLTRFTVLVGSTKMVASSTLVPSLMMNRISKLSWSEAPDGTASASSCAVATLLLVKVTVTVMTSLAPSRMTSAVSKDNSTSTTAARCVMG